MHYIECKQLIIMIGLRSMGENESNEIQDTGSGVNGVKTGTKICRKAGKMGLKMRIANKFLAFSDLG